LNETDNDCVINASSVSRKLALEYFGEFTARYHNRSSILMWELGHGNFDIISDRFSRISQPYTAPHAPCEILCVASICVGGPVLMAF